jgi:ElaB/YqjD/DUF883 family membrane-anchored ribosome-binding protein
MRLELSDDEVKGLRDTLESVLRDLSYEIANTDSLEYRENLKRIRERLEHVHDRLVREPAPGAVEPV